MKSANCMGKQTIEYTHTIVPASMRSPYWKYFGFPSNGANKILTRQKIICTICATAITYNKNTTNLRTHLIARHPEHLHEMHLQQQQQSPAFTARMISDNDAASTQMAHQIEGAHKQCTNKRIDATDQNLDSVLKIRRLNTAQHQINNAAKNNHAVCTDGNKKEIHAEDLKICFEEYQSAKANVQSLENPKACNEESDSIIINESAYVLLDSEPNTGIQRTEEENLRTSCTTEFNEDNIENDVDNFTDTETIILDTEMAQKDMVDHSTDMSSAILAKKSSHTEMLADMLVKDLLPFNILQGIGFKQFLSAIGIRNLEKFAIEKKIQTSFTTMQYFIKKYIATYLCQQDEPYSLSIETFTNNEGENIFSVYVNLIHFAPDYKLESILYDEFIYDKEAELYDILQDFDLNRCAAIVTTENNNLIIQNFCITHGIEKVPCLDALLTRCVNLIFEKDIVAEIFCRIQKLCPDHWHIPNLRCGWSKLKLLQDFLDNSSATVMRSMNTKISADLEAFMTYMNPLKITLDTIKEEPLPLCTLVRPLMVKLFEEHFSVFNTDANVYIQAAQEVINAELRNSIEQCRLFSEAVLFDGRFQHDFIQPGRQLIDHEQQQHTAFLGGASNRTELEAAVSQRFQHLLITPDLDIKTEQKAQCDAARLEPQSNLRSFFHRISDTGSGKNTSNTFARVLQSKDPFDLECRRYKCEPSLDLEQSPIYWWQSQSKQYKILYKIAKYYLCVPCYAINWKIAAHDEVEMEQRSVWQQKRKALRYQQPVDRCLWYLHYNHSLYAKIKLKE